MDGRWAELVLEEVVMEPEGRKRMGNAESRMDTEHRRHFCPHCVPPAQGGILGPWGQTCWCRPLPLGLQAVGNAVVPGCSASDRQVLCCKH